MRRWFARRCRYSYDSNIVIDALSSREEGRVALKLADRAWISRVCWIEVMSKMTGSSMDGVEEFLDGFGIEEVDQRASARAAALRPRLELPDTVILASAQTHGRILITRNTKDFLVGSFCIRVPYVIAQ